MMSADAMVPAGATFGQHQIVIAIVLVKIGAFDQFLFGKNDLRLADELFLLSGIFPEDNSGEARMILAEIPLHVHQPLAAFVIVK